MKKDRLTLRKAKATLHMELGNRITSNIAAAREGLTHLTESFKAVGFHDASHSIGRYVTLMNLMQEDFARYRGKDGVSKLHKA